MRPLLRAPFCRCASFEWGGGLTDTSVNRYSSDRFLQCLKLCVTGMSQCINANADQHLYHIIFLSDCGVRLQRFGFPPPPTDQN